MLVTPPSLREEHEEIMRSLYEYSKVATETGRAIRELLGILEPHFEKEEKLAMPILGSISELVSGNHVTNLQEIAASQGPLLQEYDVMLEEHSELKKSILKARKVAENEKRQDVVDLLDGLAHHAMVEEEVLYPAALLAGTVAKLVMSSKPAIIAGVA
jgi:hypothetical protein